MTDPIRVAILDAVPQEYWEDDEGFTDGEKFHDLLLPQLPGAQIDIFYTATGEFPESIDAYDAFLVSGSPASVHDEFPWIERLEKLIVEVDQAGKRIIGSCFGHQLIAKVYGGSVGPNESGWYIGNYPLEISCRYAWMEPAVEVTGLYHFNQERVTRLPDGAIGFADSGEYANFAYTIGDNILCLQGHPEQPLRAMHNFLVSVMSELSGDELGLAREKIETGYPDAEVWARWMARFLRA